MKIRLLACAILSLTCCWAASSDEVAARLAREAHKAQSSGQLVRAYLLYAEAAVRNPKNPAYRTNRDALASAAHLMTNADIQTANISADIKAAENAAPDADSPLELATPATRQRDSELQPPPSLAPNTTVASFDLRGDEKRLFAQVAEAYGIQVVFDSGLQSQFPNSHFVIAQADLKTALEALTAVTHTFVFALSPHAIFVANDTDQKRNEYEPKVVLTFPLPDAIDQKDLIDAANAVRSVLALRTIGWDTFSRTVMIRDRMSRARIARSLMEALLLPRAKVSFEVQFLTLDSDVSYHYGLSLPTSYNLVYFGQPGGFKSILPSFTQSLSFLAFGGGASLFGVSLTEATLFASFSKSFTQTIYDAVVNVNDGQTASLHVGDKYPIPQSLYTGFQSTSSSIYNPIGQVTLEDLGLVLKLTPHINGDADIAIDIDVALKALSTETFNTVPAVSERQFKGDITAREGQWVVIAGLDQDTKSITRTGLVGLGQIPGLDHITSENTRDTQSSKTLIVVKPTITRLPMSATISPQYLVGPGHGERVMLWAGENASSADAAGRTQPAVADSERHFDLPASYASAQQELPGLHEPVKELPKPAPLVSNGISAAEVVPPRPLRESMPDLHLLPPRTPIAPAQVFVKVDIDASGRVTEAHLLGEPNIALAISGAALTAAKQWVFQPATVRGVKSPSGHVIMFDFRGRT